MGRSKGSKNKIKKIKEIIPCMECGSINQYKFRYQLMLCAKCDNKRWWKKHKTIKIIQDRKKYQLRWNNENKQYIKQRDKEKYLRNREAILAQKKINRLKTNENDSYRYHNDVSFKMRVILRKRLWHAIKRNSKTGSAVKDLGCSIEYLKQYLESKFQPGMSWENWTKDGWHIDHIIPLASFDLTDREQFLKACHYTNLQPLWAVDNLSKGKTYE